MKSILSTIALSTLVAIASLSQVHAQTLAARANVPFAFECAGHHFAAGTYTISMLNSDNVSLFNVAKSDTELALIESIGDADSPHAPGSLTFRKYGNTYFLAKYSAHGIIVTVIESKQERSVARDYAANRMAPAPVQVAALGK